MNNNKRTIMLVDDNMASLTMGKNILKDRYDVYPIDSGEKLFEITETVTPDLILLDVNMPGMNGYEIIKKLKTSPSTREVPVIFLTSRDTPGDELEGLALGAIDYISKPFSPALVIQRIENHLILASKKRGGACSAGRPGGLPRAVIETISEFAEFRGGQTDGHIERVRNYFEIMLRKIVQEKVYEKETALWDMEVILSASALHDSGKIMVNENILCKPGKLTKEEFEEVKKHAVYGKKIIDKIKEKTDPRDFLEYAGVIALTHHERWDGLGYPDGLSGENIPLLGRVMAIADVYEALVSPRPYKSPVTHAEAVEIILEKKGTQFDPELTEIFRKAAPEFANYSAGKNPVD